MKISYISSVSHLLHKTIRIDQRSKTKLGQVNPKKYEVDPFICPKCQGQMKIISFIEELDVIEKILRHLGFWEVHNHDPPQAIISDSISELVYDVSVSQIPAVEYWN